MVALYIILGLLILGIIIKVKAVRKARAHKRGKEEFDRGMDELMEEFHAKSMASKSDSQVETYKFKVGDVVKYTSGAFGDGVVNPLYGGQYGKKTGKVTHVRIGTVQPILVQWAKGTINSYNESDLELVKVTKKPAKKVAKKTTKKSK